MFVPIFHDGRDGMEWNFRALAYASGVFHKSLISWEGGKKSKKNVSCNTTSKMMGMPAPVDPEVKHAMKLQGIFMGAAALIAIGLIRIAPAGLQAVGMASE